jgi:hypothetical protein
MGRNCTNHRRNRWKASLDRKVHVLQSNVSKATRSLKTSDAPDRLQLRLQLSLINLPFLHVLKWMAKDAVLLSPKFGERMMLLPTPRWSWQRVLIDAIVVHTSNTGEVPGVLSNRCKHAQFLIGGPQHGRLSA